MLFLTFLTRELGKILLSKDKSERTFPSSQYALTGIYLALNGGGRVIRRTSFCFFPCSKILCKAPESPKAQTVRKCFSIKIFEELFLLGFGHFPKRGYDPKSTGLRNFCWHEISLRKVPRMCKKIPNSFPSIGQTLKDIESVSKPFAY